MHTPTFPPNIKNKSRSFLWLLIAIYTFLLPNARIVYDALVGVCGQDAAGKVPLAAAVAVGCLYAGAVLLTHKNWQRILFLIPCVVIATLIMLWVDNPNKHIHVPEYVLMAWLLYAVLSKDYHTKDIFFLIFIYASLLGVVDELEQGIYPARFYGWIDMAVNSASALIGVLTIMGLRAMKPMDWNWTRRLKEIKSLGGVCVFGIIGAGLTCAALFRVQADKAFWGVYPGWLWAWNLLYLILSAGMLIASRNRLRTFRQADADMQIALLWVLPMLAILMYMHALLLFLSVSGMTFA